MRQWTKKLAALALWGLALPLLAAPHAVVDGVQAPAWVERGGARLALAPGMALESRDRLVTGFGGRALVQMADGSAVRVGENGHVGLNALGRKENGVFTAALEVAKGAFRLTTDIFRRSSDRRAINVQIGTVTAGIRGTDIWGRSDDQRDFVCLLEGRITASHPGGALVQLDQPLQFYGADKGKGPDPVASVDAAQVEKWARETELEAGSGLQKRGGRWGVRLGTYVDQAAALAVYDRATAAGYGVRIVPRQNGKTYELRLGQIPGQEEAEKLASRLAQELALPAARPYRR